MPSFFSEPLCNRHYKINFNNNKLIRHHSQPTTMTFQMIAILVTEKFLGLFLIIIHYSQFITLHNRWRQTVCLLFPLTRESTQILLHLQFIISIIVKQTLPIKPTRSFVILLFLNLSFPPWTLYFQSFHSFAITFPIFLLLMLLLLTTHLNLNHVLTLLRVIGGGVTRITWEGREEWGWQWLRSR